MTDRKSKAVRSRFVTKRVGVLRGREICDGCEKMTCVARARDGGGEVGDEPSESVGGLEVVMDNRRRYKGSLLLAMTGCWCSGLRL